MSTAAPEAPTPLRPQTGRVWRFPNLGPKGDGRGIKGAEPDPPVFEFTQTELSFFEKGEMFVLLAGTVDRMLASGVDVRELIDMARQVSEEMDSVKSVATAAASGDDDSVQAGMKMIVPIFKVLTRVMTFVPNLMEDMFLLFLHVDPWVREDVRPSLRKIPDDVGFGILEMGIAQNKDAMLDFSKRLWGKVEPLFSKVEKTEDSKAEPTSDA